jgi:hypothetical protein
MIEKEKGRNDIKVLFYGRVCIYAANVFLCGAVFLEDQNVSFENNAVRGVI